MLDWVFRSFWIREEEYNCYNDRLSSDFKQKSRRKIGTRDRKKEKSRIFSAKSTMFLEPVFSLQERCCYLYTAVLVKSIVDLFHTMLNEWDKNNTSSNNFIRPGVWRPGGNDAISCNLRFS